MADCGVASPQLRSRNCRKKEDGNVGAGRRAGCKGVLADRTNNNGDGETTNGRTGGTKDVGSEEVKQSNKKDETSSKTSNSVPKDAKLSKQKSSSGAKTEGKEGRDEFSSMEVREQVLVVRHKLEKIIHGREKDENKALSHLRFLERTDLTKEVVEATKIDLTLEAMKFIIKNPEIQKKTEKVLRKMKQPIIQKDLREISASGWRESRKPEVEEDRLEEDKLEEKLEEDKLPSLMGGLSYWMDKLTDSGKSLNSLNKQMDNFSKTVKDAVPDTPPPPALKQSKTKSKSQTVDKILEKPNTDADLDILAAGLDNMLIEDKKKKKTTKEDKLDKIIVEERKKDKSTREEKKKKEAEKEKDICDEIDAICATVSGVSLEPKKEKEKGDRNTQLFADPQIIVKTKGADILVKDKPKEDDNSLAARIKASEVVKRLAEIKTVLEKGTDAEEVLLGHLKYLETAPVTFAQLQDSMIGLSLNSFRKKPFKNPDIAGLSKTILKSWRKLAPPPPKKETVVEKVEKVEKVESFAKNSTEEIRSHCRKTVLAALRENESLPERTWVSTGDLATAIEQCIHDVFKETNMKYRNQVGTLEWESGKDSI